MRTTRRIKLYPRDAFTLSYARFGDTFPTFVDFTGWSKAPRNVTAGTEVRVVSRRAGKWTPDRLFVETAATPVLAGWVDDDGTLEIGGES